MVPIFLLPKGVNHADTTPRSRYSLCRTLARPRSRDDDDGTGIQGFCAGEKVQDPHRNSSASSFSGVEKSHRWWLSSGPWFPGPLFSQRYAEEGRAYRENPLTAYKHILINRRGYATPSLSMHTVRGREAWEEARRA